MKNVKYILLVVGIAVLSFLIYQKRTDLNRNPTTILSVRNQESINSLLEKPIKLNSAISLVSVDGNKETQIDFGNNPDSLSHIFILLTKGDCYDCYQDIPFWNNLGDISSRVQPFVIIKPEDQKYMFEFIKGQNINVPILIDINNEIFTILDNIFNAYTPICLFVNDKGVVMAATKSNYGNKESQNSYLDYIRENI